MDISYVATIRLPTEKAHGYQIMRVCAALASRGNAVVLYVPKRRNHISEDPFEYYGIERNFSVEFVECSDWIPLSSILGPVAFYLSSFSFLRTLSRRLSEGSVVYTRNAEAVWYLHARGHRCFFSAHNWNNSRLVRYFLANVRGIVCNSHGTDRAIRMSLHAPTVVIPNASDSNPYAGANKEKLRSELSLPLEKYIVLYSGHLYDWKGGATLFAAAKLLGARSDIHFVFIGGTKDDVARASKEVAGNTEVRGHQKKTLVPRFLAAADLLVLPNEKVSQESVAFTSPLKLFEYMASGTPILASDLPALREVLSEETALFAEAGNPRSFAAQIASAEENRGKALELAKRALGASSVHTWEAHAEALEEAFKAL